MNGEVVITFVYRAMGPNPFGFLLVLLRSTDGQNMSYKASGVFGYLPRYYVLPFSRQVIDIGFHPNRQTEQQFITIVDRRYDRHWKYLLLQSVPLMNHQLHYSFHHRPLRYHYNSLLKDYLSCRDDTKCIHPEDAFQSSLHQSHKSWLWWRAGWRRQFLPRIYEQLYQVEPSLLRLTDAERVGKSVQHKLIVVSVSSFILCKTDFSFPLSFRLLAFCSSLCTCCPWLLVLRVIVQYPFSSVCILKNRLCSVHFRLIEFIDWNVWYEAELTCSLLSILNWTNLSITKESNGKGEQNSDVFSEKVAKFLNFIWNYQVAMIPPTTVMLEDLWLLQTILFSLAW